MSQHMSMPQKHLVEGKRVLVRVDYNVKVDENGKIEDDTRITESLPTINHLVNSGAKVILMAHLGRPQEELAEGKSFEEVKKNSTLAPVTSHLEKIIGKKIKLAPDCVGEEVKKLVSELRKGDILMLENVRLHAEEEENELAFAAQLAELGDAYVFDGFGVAHRINGSTVGVPLLMLKTKDKIVTSGILMEKELKLWEEARKKIGYKMLVVGGKKLEEKTKAVESLYKTVDSVLVGGAVYNIIMAGKGIDVGDSVVAEKKKSYVDKGKELSEKVNNLLLAEKVVIARKSDFGDIKTIDIADGVPKGYMITDIVIDEKMKEEISKAEVIIWFGNIGISDRKINHAYPFAKGTQDFKSTINKSCYVIVGGGDSVTASQGINRVVSTGGGASIALYIKGTLDALEALRGNFEYFEKKK